MRVSFQRIGLTLMLGLLPLLTRCSTKLVTLAELPLSPAAEVKPLAGAYEVLIDLRANELQAALKDKYGKARIEIYTCPGPRLLNHQLSTVTPNCNSL